MKNYQKGIILVTTVFVALAGGYLLGKASIKSAKQNEITVLAEDTDPVVGEGIVNHTLALSDTIYLGYYVHDSVSLNDGEEIKVYVWNNLENAENAAEPAYICDFYENIVSESGTEYGLYLLKGLGYKNMVDVLYAREVVTSQGRTVRSSEIDEYSMLDYCFNHKDDPACVNDSSYPLGDLIKEMVNYATSCQKYFNYKTDYLAVDHYWYPKKAIGYTNFGEYFIDLNDFSLFAFSGKTYSSTLTITFIKSFICDETIDFAYKGAQTIINFVEGTEFLSKVNFKENEIASKRGMTSILNAKFSNKVTASGIEISFNDCIFLKEVEVRNGTVRKDYLNVEFNECTFCSSRSNGSPIFCNDIANITFNGCKFKTSVDFKMFVLQIKDSYKIYFHNCEYDEGFIPKFDMTIEGRFGSMSIEVWETDYNDSNSGFAGTYFSEGISLHVIQ